ncbi:MAG TPA: LysR family transcriptional regulator [Alphaproteobacteria bacterium]|nr:LysR family transcriptional regulator [Alphaproteobacteria bacterium]
MEMHQIRYFLAICETLNFTRAAERCNVTQPALTRAIQKLEEEVGGPLFRRERIATHLTHLGQLVRPHLEQILADSQAAMSTARSFLSVDNASLRLGAMCTIGPIRFVGFLAYLRQLQPKLLITLSEAVPDELIRQLIGEEVDVAIAALPGGFPDRFRATPLYRERYVVAFPPGHRFENRQVVRVADMTGESYLSRLNCEYYDYLGQLCRERQVELRNAYGSEQEDWIQTMVLAGMGISFLPEFLPVIPGIHTRPIADPEVIREVVLLTVAGRPFTPALASFHEAVRRYRWPTPPGSPSDPQNRLEQA